MGTLAPQKAPLPPRDANLQNAVLHSLLRSIEQGLRESLPETDGGTHLPTHTNTRIGAVVFIYRCGGLRNAHLHFHAVFIDGVFCGEDAGHLRLQETRLLAEQMAHLQRTIRQRIVRLFVRRGLLDKAEGQAANTTAASLSAPMCASKPTIGKDWSVSCTTVPDQPLPRNGCASSTRNISSTRARNPDRVAKSACCSLYTHYSTDSRH